MADKHPLTETEISKVPETSGVYKIHSDLTFQRLNGDTDIVYIGKARSLRSRLATFVRGTGRKGLPRFQRLQRAGFKLLFSYEPCLDPKQKEAEELKQYECDHFELPPLNRSSAS